MIDLPSELQIGVPSIDREHYVLFKLLDRVLADANGTLQSERCSEFLTKLAKHIAQHFDSEERFLRSCGMPQDDVASHVEAHDAILEQYAQLNLDMMTDEELALSGAARNIKQWIIGHLLEHDVKIRPYVTAQVAPSDDSHGHPNG